MDNWQDHVGDTLYIRVTPKASAERIKPELQPDGRLLLRVYVTTVPENGKANEAVIKLLSKAMKLFKSSFTIVQGELSKDKMIKVSR